MEKMKVAIIGAGASGMMAAISAAKYGAEVTLFEKNERVGKKILATGNGKCNLGNLAFSTDHYYCEDKEKLHKIFRVFSVWDAMMFFENIGLMVKSKNGYLYPYSEQASAVLDVLRMELKRAKIRVMTEVEITDAGYCDKDGLFELKDNSGNGFQFNKLIIACGSGASLKKGEGMRGYELAQRFGHRISPLAPGLVQLESNDSFIKALSGVRCHAGIKLLVDGDEVASENGELQFTQYGVSGIPIFQVSRIAAYAIREGKKVDILVDFFPEQDDKTFTYMNRLRYESLLDKKLEDYLTGTLHKKINTVMLKQAGLKPAMTAKDAGWQAVLALMEQYLAFAIQICGDHSVENAQVCAGGVMLSQISTEMESEIVKGLYFAGELVDVDGNCGGYNLQWAWTSGYVAGRNAAGSSTKEIAEDEEGQLKKEEIQKEN